MSIKIKIALVVLITVIIIVSVIFAVRALGTTVTITVARPMGQQDRYLEHIGHVYTGFPGDRVLEQSGEVSDVCTDFILKFNDEHKNDKYHIEADITLEDGKTKILFHGTITPEGTEKAIKYEKEFIFDYIYATETQT